MTNRTNFPKSDKLTVYSKIDNLGGVLRMIGEDAYINARSGRHGTTPLIEAVMEGNSQIANVLISNGADVRRRDSEGSTALHWAEDPEMIKMLIRHGADVNARDKFDHTPLSAKMLRISCANPNIIEECSEKIEVLIANGATDPKVKVNEREVILSIKDKQSGQTIIVGLIRKGKIDKGTLMAASS